MPMNNPNRLEKIEEDIDSIKNTVNELKLTTTVMKNDVELLKKIVFGVCGLMLVAMVTQFIGRQVEITKIQAVLETIQRNQPRTAQ